MVPDQQWAAAYLGQAIAEFHSDPRTPRLLQRLAREHPDLFFAAAADHLESDVDLPAYRFLAGLVIRQESMFEWLVDPARCSFASAIRLFRRLLSVDPALDFRLARMLPGRNDSNRNKVLRGGHASRAIDILDQTSPGQRLMSVVGHLPNSEDAGISAKAALLVGRRVNNPAWTAKQLAREDHRVRANAVEASWGTKSEAAIRILEICARDPNNRVVGNALVGLHMAECPDVPERTLALSVSEQPELRSTAAWAMGKIGSPAFIERLRRLLNDEHPRVRSIAIRSLVEIGRAEGIRVAAIAAGAKQKEAESAAEPVAHQEATGTTVQDLTALDRVLSVPAAPYEIKLDGSSFKAARR